MIIRTIGEIGTNSNGDIEIAKKLISIASLSGFSFVKFQKRNPDICVPENQKNELRKTPWGEMSYIDYKHKLEFNEAQYDELKAHADLYSIHMFASVWDMDSLFFMKKYTSMVKIPSAMITNDELLVAARKNYSVVLLSTGMSTEEQIDKAVKLSNPDVIFHTNSVYPCKTEEMHLEYIKWLKNKYPNKHIGLSAHDFGLVSSYVAIGMGADWIEKHITLSHDMWGSDQASSVEPMGMFKFGKAIRDIEIAMVGNEPRTVYEGEAAKIKSLRGSP